MAQSTSSATKSPISQPDMELITIMNQCKELAQMIDSSSSVTSILQLDHTQVGLREAQQLLKTADYYAIKKYSGYKDSFEAIFDHLYLNIPQAPNWHINSDQAEMMKLFPLTDKITMIFESHLRVYITSKYKTISIILPKIVGIAGLLIADLPIYNSDDPQGYVNTVPALLSALFKNYRADYWTSFVQNGWSIQLTRK